MNITKMEGSVPAVRMFSIGVTGSDAFLLLLFHHINLSNLVMLVFILLISRPAQ